MSDPRPTLRQLLVFDGTHRRSLWQVCPPEEAYATKCSCGWASRISSRKANVASAWGMHAAAVERRGGKVAR